MNRRRRGSGDTDIPLDVPLARHTDVVAAIEDRSYVAFIAGAMLLAIVAGFPLAVLSSLATAGHFWAERVPWLVQAHGWVQLQGWAGLFVAGMGLRLLPRFAGNRPFGRRVTLAVFGGLAGGAVLRTAAQILGGGGVSPALFVSGQSLWAAGAFAFAGAVGSTLIRTRRPWEPWSVFALGGAGWWGAWALAAFVIGIRGARNDAYVGFYPGDATAWVAMLGAIGSFIWGIQSRSVPIFFGRRTPTIRTVVAPALLLNLGVALVYVSAWMGDGSGRARIEGGGLAMAGAATAWLAPLAGACWGSARRLRPRARGASRFVLAANLSAVACGGLIAWAGAQTLAEGSFAEPGVRDAARQVFGVGVITMLIIGMAQLVAPFFAMQRVESTGNWLLNRAAFGSLCLSLALRTGSGLLRELLNLDARMYMNAAAGTLAWIALVLFAAAVFRAIRREPAVKAAIAEAASPARVE